jgi:hypothetical protein
VFQWKAKRYLITLETQLHDLPVEEFMHSMTVIRTLQPQTDFQPQFADEGCECDGQTHTHKRHKRQAVMPRSVTQAD